MVVHLHNVHNVGKGLVLKSEARRAAREEMWAELLLRFLLSAGGKVGQPTDAPTNVDG
jgi:hypothetical protein